MNHRPQNLAPHACGTGDLPMQRSCERGLTVSQAIEGFILHKTCAGYFIHPLEKGLKK